MKLFLAFVLCVLFCSISPSIDAERAVWIAGESGIHPDHPGKCWSQSLKQEFNIGEQFTDKPKCELLKCGPNFRFSRRICSVRQPQPGCSKTKPDSSKNYPDCCGMIQCAPVKIDY